LDFEWHSSGRAFRRRNGAVPNHFCTDFQRAIILLKCKRSIAFGSSSRKEDNPITERIDRPVLNLNAAKQIGLTIPQSVLARADRVIK